MKAIVWMHRDLRLSDNPALSGALQAVQKGEASTVDVVFSWSNAVYGDWMPGEAQRWWIHVHLEDLLQRMAGFGVCLVATRKSPSEFVAAANGVHSIHFNDPLLPAAREEAERLRGEALTLGIPTVEYTGDLLHDPEQIRTGKGDAYKVFTPFSRRFMEQMPPERCEPLAVDWDGGKDSLKNTCHVATPEAARAMAREAQQGLDTLGLYPRHDWVAPLNSAWEVGEAAAHARLQGFVEGPVLGYASGRDRPDTDATSRLSPYLSIGVLSPRQVHAAVTKVRGAASREPGMEAQTGTEGIDTYVRELVWREFGYHLLRHFPRTPSEPLRPEWNHFPWRDDEAALERWQHGMTGFPIVDAGMRQLWKTGWMHNRVRMITASFLTKDLIISWQQGAAWFWNTLIDADLASNTLGWQWAAGSGADAQPYFRIFNPESQLKKHDPRGTYVRQWIPELDELTYPSPMVDHAAARTRALSAYKSFRN